MNILYSEQSQRTRSAELLVVVFVILLVGAMVFTTYRSIAQGHILLSEYFIEIMALIVIVKQAVSRYTYILILNLSSKKNPFLENVHFL